MIENTDAEQIERLNRRIVELLREVDHLKPYVEAFRREETRADKLGARVDVLLQERDARDCKCHQWSLIETAPKDGAEILGWWSGSRAHTIISWSSEGWWKDCADDSAVSPPTHWQSLTDGPTVPAPKGAK